MKTRILSSVVVVMMAAMVLQLGSANAQTLADLDPPLWCIQMRESIMRNHQAVENMRAARQAGINNLRAEHQVLATRNLEQWYWKKVEAIFQQKRALDAQCNWMNIRPDAPSPGRVAPLPRPSNPPRNNSGGLRPKPNNQTPGAYKPYERYPEPSDPFSPNLRR